MTSAHVAPATASPHSGLTLAPVRVPNHFQENTNFHSHGPPLAGPSPQGQRSELFWFLSKEKRTSCQQHFIEGL